MGTRAARESPGRQPRAPREEKPGRVMGERPRWKTGRGKKNHYRCLAEQGFSAKEQGRNRDGWAWSRGRGCSEL